MLKGILNFQIENAIKKINDEDLNNYRIRNTRNTEYL